MTNVTKTILLWAMVVGIAGCVYDDVDMSKYDYPVWVSSKYALAPNTRWTTLHYCGFKGWYPEVSMEISRDSHRVLFLRWDLDEDRSPTIYDGVVTADRWNWIVSQLEHAGVSRWKVFYAPSEVTSEVIRDEGNSWYLEFLDGSNIVGRVGGLAVWPKGWNAFQSILDSFDVVQKDSR